MTQGTPAPLFIAVEGLGDQPGARHAFIKSPVRIGRSELNDLPLPSPFVSGWHAVVQFDEQDITYVDLGSTNGSTLDGVALERNVPAKVGPDSEVGIGSVRLRFGRRGVMPEGAPERPITSFSLRVSQLRTPAPPPRATPPPVELAPSERELVDSALSTAAMELDLQYASYRGAWEHLLALIDQSLTGLDGASKAFALTRFAEKYEALRQEPRFRELAGLPPLDARPAEPPVPRGPTTDLVAAFGSAYLPGPAEQAGRADPHELLTRTAELLEAFSTSYLELRKGYEEFGREMGVSPVRGDGQMGRARDPRELLAYLLDPRAQGRKDELQRAFADLMVHQVALLNGVVEGARGLLAKLDPEAVAASVSHSMFHARAAEQWREYGERWHGLADEDDGISAALFGPEFARAYTAVIGRRLEDARVT